MPNPVHVVCECPLIGLFVVKEIFVTMTLPQLKEVEMMNFATNQDALKLPQLQPPSSLQLLLHLDPQVFGLPNCNTFIC